ncbi:hypothetical protein KCP75_20305 [Salmonella enterica subsp. enterica]|nr:hypothetical protein KCP75_20305 [Salmonella enterica subsp. enterica]
MLEANGYRQLATQQQQMAAMPGGRRRYSAGQQYRSFRNWNGMSVMPVELVNMIHDASVATSRWLPWFQMGIAGTFPRVQWNSESA